MSNPDLILPLTSDQTQQLVTYAYTAGVPTERDSLQAWFIASLLRGARELALEAPNANARLDAVLADVRQPQIPDQPLPHERQAEVRRNYEARQAAEPPPCMLIDDRPPLADVDDVLSLVRNRRAARYTDELRQQAETQLVSRRLAEMNRMTDMILGRLRQGNVHLPAYCTSEHPLPGMPSTMPIPPNCDSGRGGRMIRFGQVMSLQVQPGQIGRVNGTRQFAWVCQVLSAGHQVGEFQRQCGTERELKRWFADVIGRYECPPEETIQQTINPHYHGGGIGDRVDEYGHEIPPPEPSTSMTRRERVIELLGD